MLHALIFSYRVTITEIALSHYSQTSDSRYKNTLSASLSVCLFTCLFFHLSVCLSYELFVCDEA